MTIHAKLKWISIVTSLFLILLAGVSYYTNTQIEGVLIQDNRAVKDAEAIALLEEVNTILLVSTFLFILLMLGFTRSVARSITQPLNTLSIAMQRLSHNDVTVDVAGLERTDELGSMAESVQLFKEAILDKKRAEIEQSALTKKVDEEKKTAMHMLAAKFETQINSIVHIVTHSAESLSTISETLNKSVEDFSHNAHDATADADKTTVNIQMVASATEHMSSSVSEISAQLIKSTNLVDQSVHYVEGADIHADALKTASGKVREVVQIVADIAEKINLLALNATIESARAGEAGKGFAVVASEVKNLASQTNQSIQEIEKVINQMNTASTDIITTLANIKLSTTQISESFSSISSALEEQSATTNEIAHNMHMAVHGTEAVTDKLHAVEAHSDSANHSAHQVSDAAKLLSLQAKELNNEVQRFLQDLRAA